MAKKSLYVLIAAFAALGIIAGAGINTASADAQSEIAMELSTGIVLC